MSKGRIALVAAGLLLGGVALLLMARGLRGAAATLPPEPAAPESRGRAGERDKEPPPRWQSFLRPGEKAAPPRPVARLARKGLADPFDRPQGAAPRPAGNPGLRLQGISNGLRAVALVSGRAVREGDELAGYRVVRIGRSGVTLAGPGGRVDLALPAREVGR